MRVAIVGAGLGGVTAAILFARAGHKVQVFEQSPVLLRIGAGIGLGPNVLRVMQHVGVYERMMERGIVLTRALSRVWDTGDIIFEQRSAEWTEAFGLPTLTMHRGDMLKYLVDQLPQDALHLGKRVIDLEPAGDHTRIRFADGGTVDADVVIGADGVNSRIREILFGVRPPKYTNVVAYRSIFPTALLGGATLSADMTKWWSDDRHPAAEDRHFIAYYLTADRSEVYFVTGSPEPNWPGGVSSIPADIAEIRRCYEGFHPEVQGLIDACPAASKWPLLEQDPIPLWNAENVVLLGDACHPMKPHMGQGAGMAIEDAAVLVRCFERAADDRHRAFALYYANRFERTARVQRMSHVNSWMREDTDPSWVYGYDATRVSLTAGDSPR